MHGEPWEGSQSSQQGSQQGSRTIQAFDDTNRIKSLEGLEGGDLVRE